MAKTLSKRLRAAADFVRPGAVVADIGTDHGLLPVELVRSGRAQFAYACDVNEKPLQKARELIGASGLSELVEVRLSDGLLALVGEQIDDIVIAGLGYDQIAAILENAKLFDRRALRFILQCMTKTEQLRAHLYKNGYAIDDETAVFEGGHGYSVLCARYTGVQREIGLAQAYCGAHLTKTGEASARYRAMQAKRLERIAQGLFSAGLLDTGGLAAAAEQIRAL